MNKESLPVGISVVVMVALFIFYPKYYQPSFDLGTETIVIENVSFVGFSGEASNSLVLYVRNTGTREVVLDMANITCVDWERMLSVASEESVFPVESSGRVVLFNVGWVKDVEYKIDVFSSNGQLVGAKLVTA
jgi:hypothetical protein